MKKVTAISLIVSTLLVGCGQIDNIASDVDTEYSDSTSTEIHIEEPGSVDESNTISIEQQTDVGCLEIEPETENLTGDITDKNNENEYSKRLVGCWGELRQLDDIYYDGDIPISYTARNLDSKYDNITAFNKEGQAFDVAVYSSEPKSSIEELDSTDEFIVYTDTENDDTYYFEKSDKWIRFRYVTDYEVTDDKLTVLSPLDRDVSWTLMQFSGENNLKLSYYEGGLTEYLELERVTEYEPMIDYVHIGQNNIAGGN